MAGQPRVRLYRELLTVALHRRFTRAAGLTLLICYLEAIAIGDKSSFLWIWFPAGPTGIRTLLLFMSCLSIFILRVAQLHFGAITTISPFTTFKRSLGCSNTLQTFIFYFFSAWWFGEVYLWSAPADADLGWVSSRRLYQREQLNERPIYLRSVFLIVAIFQTIVHLYCDYDRINLPIHLSKKNTQSAREPNLAITPIEKIKRVLPIRVKVALARTIAMNVITPFVYAFFMRQRAWNLFLHLARLLWHIPRASRPSTIPLHLTGLIFRSTTSTFLLIFIWEFSNAIFEAYVAQEPLKQSRALTDDSTDPNGSLMNGLKSKRETTRIFAFCELSNISRNSEIRRKSIFSEFDRTTGSTWSSILSVTLDTIRGIDARIREFRNAQTSSAISSQQQPGVIESLPRLTFPPSEGLIFVSPPPPANTLEKAESGFRTLARSYGQSPSTDPELFPNPLSPCAKQYLRVARDKVLSPEQQQAMSKEGLSSSLFSYILRLLRSPAGIPFRQTFKRRMRVVVLGSPFSEYASIIYAIQSIACLAIASVKDDQYGTANKDIPLLIRSFTNTTNNIELLCQDLPVHWTDVEFDSANAAARGVEEIDILLQCLKGALKDLIEAFEHYATDLGLGQRELRVAREVAGLDKA